MNWKGAWGLTNYERIKRMTEKQLANFLADFCVMQLPNDLRKRAKNTVGFKKKIEKFLRYEVDYDEYDDREVII